MIAPTPPAPTNHLQWATRFQYRSNDEAGTLPPMQAVSRLAEALMSAAADDRLASMQCPEWSFTTDHIGQVHHVMEQFLSPPERRELRNLTKSFVSEQRDPAGIVQEWFTDERCQILKDLLNKTDVPDPLLVACYAWLEVHDAAQAAYLIHTNRSLPRPDFSKIVLSPEEEAGDIRFAQSI